MATRIESAKDATPGAILMVVHEFVARSPDELSLSKGDRIELIERDDDFGDGWYLGRHLQTGATGLFPEVYTTIAPKSTLSARPTARPRTVEQQQTAPTVESPTAFPTVVEKSSDSATAPVTAAPAPAFANAAPAPSSFSPSSATHSQSNIYSPSQPFAQQVGGAKDAHGHGRSSTQNSAVMNETLSVIDEHITDMNSPTSLRSPSVKQAMGRRDDRQQQRLSYIAGSETEEEEEQAHKSPEFDVASWSPEKVADYLASMGVEKKHCDIFQEQEFSGEVILTMEQSTVFLKELDLGPIGRRLKTWGRIKALQDEVKARAKAAKSKRTSEQDAQSIQSPLGIISGVAGQQTARPSAASIRSYGHSRRPSSNDPNSLSPDMSNTIHNKHPSQQSLDRGWTMSSANRSTSAVNDPRSSQYQPYGAGRQPGETPVQGPSSISGLTAEMERGYMSGGEHEFGSKARRLLRKKSPTPDHQRQSSQESSKRRLSFFSKKSSIHPASVTEKDTSATPSIAPTDPDSFPNHRVVSEPLMDASAPIVTKLEYGPDPTKVDVTTIDSGEGSVSSRRGFRTTSDVITGREKALHRIPVDKVPTAGDVPPSTRSSTPSALSYEDANQSKFSTASTLLSTSGTRRKTKKSTSAYILGLEKKTPLEQRLHADYSGWMKKKSSNLMTNWKPRYFVLKGRRLSYYYSEEDTEEKGLIDISGHRVLSAEGERITGLHASLTGATTSPTSPQASSLANGSLTQSPINITSPINAEDALAASTNSAVLGLKETKEGFIFKLVPPRTGMSRAVNFTKPAVHYFAVSSLEEGRQWMAALMKATIERDESADVVTTYQQKTISLAKARARKERPPALKNLDEEGQATSAAAEPSNLNVEANTTASNAEAVPAVADDLERKLTQTTVGSPQREQVTPVTDLENSFSRTRTNSSARHRFARDKGAKSPSNDGLGLENERGSPIMTRMQQSGLW